MIAFSWGNRVTADRHRLQGFLQTCSQPFQSTIAHQDGSTLSHVDEGHVHHGTDANAGSASGSHGQASVQQEQHDTVADWFAAIPCGQSPFGAYYPYGYAQGGGETPATFRWEGGSWDPGARGHTLRPVAVRRLWPGGACATRVRDAGEPSVGGRDGRQGLSSTVGTVLEQLFQHLNLEVLERSNTSSEKVLEHCSNTSLEEVLEQLCP